MKFILILWLVGVNFADSRGGIESVVFNDEESCLNALQAVAKKAEKISGVCVKQASK